MRVKSLGIPAALGIVCALPAVAQNGVRSTEVGIKGGIPFATWSVDDPEGAELKSRVGIGGGAFVHVPLGPVGLQLELLFMQKGTTLTVGDIDPFTDLTIALDYLEVPLLLTVPIPVGASISPYLFGGPAIAYEVGCSLKGEQEGISAEIDCDAEIGEVDFEAPTKDVDVGLTAGAGLRLPMGSGALLLEGRYTFGLTNINNSPENSNEFKNRAGAVMVGFSFPLSR